ncbi:MAG: ABC transporter permease [Chloroflexi bacterium]|nr:ABC transporter permease [Chloroflexota bacterium]
MARFIVRRLLWLIPVLGFVSFITFSLMHLVPGGPWDRDKKLAPAVVEALNRRYGLDKPFHEQYLNFVANALQGDLGVSYTYQDRGVTEIIMQGFPTTATLGALALLISVLLGISLGTIAALRPNSWVDYLSIAFATLGAAAPSFVIGIVLVIVFSVWLHLLPTSGWGTPAKAVLPALALGAYPAAFLARLTRSSMLEVLSQDYIRTARAKGLAYQTMLIRHAVKNALIPVLTVAGPIAAFFATGSFVIENLFSIPGIGRLFVQGVFQRDYGLIMGTTLFYAFIVAIANLVVDVLYAFVDPRIRYQ